MSGWYSYDPGTGIEHYDTQEEAEAGAKRILAHYRCISRDGVTGVSWGRLYQYGHSVECVSSIETAEGEVDECTYQLETTCVDSSHVEEISGLLDDLLNAAQANRDSGSGIDVEALSERVGWAKGTIKSVLEDIGRG